MIQVGGKQFRTLDDDLHVNGKKVYWAAANNNVVYPERDSRRYVLRFSGEVNTTWQHTCYDNYGNARTFTHFMTGKFVCAVRSTSKISSLGTGTIAAESATPYYGDEFHTMVNRPVMETIYFNGFDAHGTSGSYDQIYEIAGYGQMGYVLHDTFESPYGQAWYKYMTDETQAAFQDGNGKKRMYAGKGRDNNSGISLMTPSYAPNPRVYCVGVDIDNVPYREVINGTERYVSEDMLVAVIPITKIDYANYDPSSGGSSVITEDAPLEMMHVSINDI